MSSVPGHGRLAVRGLSQASLDLDEFRNDGYLQEVNRRFFHPLGLALAVVYGNQEQLVVLDYRHDPEGVRYDEVDLRKFERVRLEWAHRQVDRLARLGHMVQPVEGVDPDGG